MSEQPAPTAEGTFNADLRGVHFDFLKDRVPGWFNQGSTARQEELAHHELQLPRWYLTATAQQKADLADSHTRYRETLNQVENTLGDIKDVLAFAEQPLKDALKQRFNLDVDVKNVYFARKYGFKSRDDLFGFLVFDQQRDSELNYVYRAVSLLEAALANFEPDEERASACNDCQIITAWSSYDGDVIPTFSAVNSQALAIAPHEFAQVCRSLDVGNLYQQHIKAIVQPDEATQRTALETQLQEHQRQLLALSAEMAAHQTEWGIGADAYRMIKQVITDPGSATLDGKPVTFAALKVFGSVLVGPLLIGPARKDSDSVERLVVFIPNDPQQPLKEYASSAEFMADLRTRLHSASYRRFFSRFVPQREQGIFFQRFNGLYKPANGNGAEGDYPMASKPVRLPLEEMSIKGNLWTQLREAQVRKILSDARAVAVPTGDEDREARMARLASYADAVISVFNLGAFVVPGLGPIMLAVGAAQMCTEVYDGIEAYEQSDLKTMWAHFSSVALNAAMLGTGAKVLPAIKLASVVDNLKRVTLPSGKQRLWKPDLSSYEHLQPIPSGAAVDERGLHRVNGTTLLPLDGRRYVVRQDPVTEDYRIVHPTRPDAYQPTLTGNGSGLWNHELERPQSWEGAPLMRRLGPVADGFSDAELEQVRRVADVSEDVLRRVHVEGEPAPAILLDTLRQFRAYRDAVKVAEGIRQGSLSNDLCSYAASLMVELPRWPASVAIEAFSSEEVGGASIKYGNSLAAASDTLRIHRGELMNGQLPKRVIESLSEAQLIDLVGRFSGTPEARTAALQTQLEQHAIRVRSRLMNSIYLAQQPPSDTAITLVQRQFSTLPAHLVRELLADVTPSEREIMTGTGTIPFRLLEKARLAQQQMRLTHAYEGLYLDDLANKDTEALVLNSLANVPGWSDGLRLEVREGRLEGELRASFGPVDAAERKVLVRVDDGRYQAMDARGQDLHGINGLYGSLQHALPDAHRNAIGLPDVGQGEQLKALIAEKALSRAQLRSVLGMQPPKQFFRPPTVLADGRRGYSLSGRGGSVWDQVVRERILSLYPDLTTAEVIALREKRGWSDDQWLKRLEQERKVFESTMNRWLSTHTEGVERFSEADRNALKAKRAIYGTLHGALKEIGPRHYDTHGQYVGQKIEWVGADLQEQLRTLPALGANFDRVTQLTLDSSNATDADVRRLLVNFRGLRDLSLENGELTELPQAIGDMPHLRSLNLGSNRIALTPVEVTLLSRATRLEALSLRNNRLERAPDVSGMKRLRTLWLSNTNLQEWPAGVFRVPRPRDFRLDLMDNPINRVPVFAPGSDNALIVARTLLSREKLATPELLTQFKQYIEAAGYDPERQFPARGEYDRRLWNTGVPQDEWSSKQRLWDHLEQSFGSEGFFNELRLLRRSGDAQVDSGRLLPKLTAKVWRMLEAMGEDAGLRDELFLMARNSSACEDAGAQLFNAMGVEVLLRAAYASEDASVVQRSVFNLARGKWRLDELGRIAHRRVGQLQAQGVQYPQYDAEGAPIVHYDADGVEILPIDEVEIYLSYTAPLASRLNLPWQAESMLYREDYVTAQMVEDAFTHVTALDQGEVLRGNLLEQPMWVDYLHRAHQQAFSSVRNKYDALIDLETALAKWLDSASLSMQEREGLRATISDTSALLGRTGLASQPGYVMIQQEYNMSFASIEAEYQRLLSTLTDQTINSLLPAS
jgi:hypothetical protein